MYNFLSHLFKLISEFYINKSNQSIYGFERYFGPLSDEELKNYCRRFYLGETSEKTNKDHSSIKDFTVNLFSKIISFFSPRTSLEVQTLEQVALAVEVFKRSPADLPKDSRLFPQQISAAVSLTQRCLVQMDTGEGKTYAILPAAFSLACHYGKVYIVCANTHLAFRDAKRTRSFWDFMGLEVGLCNEANQSDANWDCPIIYTTLDALIFTHLLNESGRTVPEHPVKFGAVILDEADAILLDNNDGYYSVVHNIRSESYDWSFATSFAKLLQKSVHITEQYDYLAAALTLDGEELLKEALHRQFGNIENYLVFRQAVEYAYAGLFLAKEGVHYVSDKNRLHPIDLLTGKIAYNQDRNWIFPIEHILSFPPRIEKVVFHTLVIGNFFKMFNHISGTSGSIVDDLTEYFFSYLLFTITIPPRKPRYKGEKLDRVWKTKKEAKKALMIAAIEAVKTGRPVLIGVQNINDAEDIYNLLQHNTELAGHCQELRIVTGKNEENIAEIFERAGQEKVITVATQLAGRGVDIRLSSQARNNGGLALLCLEHSLTMRHDKQFLGRAGRQGDPFTGAFFVSLEDELMLRFGSEAIAKLMNKLGYKEDEVIQHSLITSSIVRAQKKVQNNDFISRRTGSLIEMAEKEVYSSLRIWLEYSKPVLENGKLALSEYFIKWLIDKYISEDVEILIPDQKEFTWQDCLPIVQKIKEDTAIEIDTLEIEGRQKPNIISKLKEKVYELLYKEIKENESMQSQLNHTFTDKDKYYKAIKDEVDKLKNYYHDVLNILDTLENQKQQDVDNNTQEELIETPKNIPYQYDTQKASILSEQSDEVKTKNETQNSNLEILDYFEQLSRYFRCDQEDKLRELKSNFMAYSEFTFDDWQDLKFVIVELHNQLLHVKGEAFKQAQHAYNKHMLYSSRTPSNIVYWSLFKTRIDYLTDNKRDMLRIRHATQNNSIDYNRMLCDELIKDWERVESRLPSYMLKNLANTNNPQQLNTLFFYEDNNVVDYEGNKIDVTEQQHKLIWEKEKNKNGNWLKISDGKLTVSTLVNQFLNNINDDFSLKSYTKNDIQHTLNRFTQLCPIAKLRTPDKIQEAIETWKKEEISLHIIKKRREKNKEWVATFLKYLSEQEIIAALPSLKIKFKSQVHRLIENISDPKTIIAIFQPFLFLIIFCLFTVLGRWLEPKRLSSWQLYLDYLLFGGLISTGAITSACFFVTILDKVTVNRYINFFLTVVCLFTLGWYQIKWITYQSIFVLFTNVMVFVVMVYLSYRTLLTNKATKISTGVSMQSGWICFCILLVFFPKTFGWYSVATATLLIVSLCYYYWRTKINYDELTLLSSLTNSITTLKSEDVRSCLKVEGSVGYKPHLYAALGTFSLFLLIHTSFIKEKLGLNFEIVQDVSLLLAYILILLIMIQATIKTRLSLPLWRKELNRRHVILIDGDATEKKVELNLSDELNSYYRKFFLFEIVFQLAIVSLCFMLFRKQLMQTNLPAFTLLPLIIFLFAENFFDLSHQLFKILISRSPVSFEQIDFSNLQYEEKHNFSWERFNSIRFVKKLFLCVFLILTIIKYIFDFVSGAKDIIKYLKDLF